MSFNETEHEFRLRKAKESVSYCVQAETEAIRALAAARSSLTQAREKYEALFLECERRAVARIKSGGAA
jgi:hypothetical protein